MDCDDQLGIVKRDDDSHPLSTNKADIGPFSVSTELDAIRPGDEPFGVGDRYTNLPRSILGVSRKAHPDKGPGVPISPLG